MNFPPTQWSLIVASGEGDAARAAWSELAARYRAPIHGYFRCRFGADRADDLTGAFFVESIAGGWWARADIARGSFRTYLRMLLVRFGARHASSLRADGDGDSVEQLDDPGGGPEAVYDREFAHTVVNGALAKLRGEVGDSAGSLWDLLLERGDPGEIRRLAERMGLSPNVASQRLRRMKLRLRDLITEEFAALVADPASIDGEVQSLRSVLVAK